jgi:hypothetical protein
MTRLTYTARRKSGEKVSGTVDADSKTEAIRKIEALGCVPVSVQAGNLAASPPPVPKQKTTSVALAAVVGVVCLFGLFGVITAFRSEPAATPQITRPAPEPVERAPTYTREPTKEFSEVMAQSIRDSVAERRRKAELVQPRSDFPNVLSVLGVLYEGEGILDTGKYSRDQQAQVFSDKFKDKQYFVYGQISDVGTTAFGGRKYITIMVTEGHYFDVYPSEDFDLLAYAKGQRIGFVGTWTSLVTGIMVKHTIEHAFDSSAVGRVAATPQRPQGPLIPSDQQAFAQRLRQFSASYREVANLNNDLRVKEVTTEAKTFLDETRQVYNWIGTVQKVADSLGSSWVSVTADGVEYNLWPKDKGLFSGNEPLPIFRNLSKGQNVRFTGQMYGSMRLTTSGAITDPCMKIDPTSIEIIQ